MGYPVANLLANLIKFLLETTIAFDTLFYGIRFR